MHQILRYLDICDGNMEEGSLRCDANISVRPLAKATSAKTEVKNLNSLRLLSVQLILRLNDKLSCWRRVRSFKKPGITMSPRIARSLRSKEEAHDYRYFPDPDLVPLIIDEAWVKTIRQSLPELAEQRRTRYQLEIGLPEDIASG